MMKKFLNLSRKLGFILAIFGAAIIGGASTALVSAIIPSSTDGQIHGCFRNNGNLLNPAGDLRVVDSDEGQTCTAQETSLNWDSKSNIKTAFAKVNYDQATQTWSLDETKTKNISNFQVITANDGFPAICLVTTDLTPKNLVVTGTLGAYASTNGLKDETGWTLPDQSCDQVEGADVFFSAVGMDMFVLVHGL